MAISRSLMNRQLRASGGIMDVTPRENFGLGSSLKKFVRKIIPNEIADIAVKAAPFVAPFNPALAGVMSGIGTFDQTGSIGSGLKAGAMNYGGGQLARYVGGGAQNLQGNPFGQGGAFTQGGFRGGFSSPISDQGGLGKLFSNQGSQPIQGVGGENYVNELSLPNNAANAVSGGAETLANASELSFVPNNATSALVDASDMALVGDVKQAAAKEFNLFKAVGDFDYKSLGNKTLELGKKFGKAMFTNKDGSIDKAAVMGAIAFAGSYAEALALADDAGVELTEEAYDEAKKTEKKEEYAGYLTNFFGGKKDGGRIGYARGTPGDNTMFEELNVDTIYRPEPESTITLPEELPGDDKMAGSQGYDEQYNSFIQLRDQFQYQEGDSYSEANRKAKQIVYGMKDGGRINRRLGSPEEGEGSGLMEMLSVEVDAGGDEEEENMMMAYEPGSFKKDKFKPMEIDAINERLQTFLDMEGGGLPLPLVGTVKGIANTLKAGKAVFTGPEKTTIIRNLAGRSRGTNAYKELGKSIPEAKRIMDNPIDYLKDAAIFKELLKGIFKKDGGRIGYKDGTGSSNRVAQLMLERDYLLSKDEDVSFIDLELERDFGIQMKAEGGIMEAKVPTGQMRKNNAGVAERDYRQTGGFVPVGIKERADDVPAMLSKNEFVMTADAVRGIGNGSVEEGSKKLYNTMKQAEQVGKA